MQSPDDIVGALHFKQKRWATLLEFCVNKSSLRVTHLLISLSYPKYTASTWQRAPAIRPR